MVMSKVTLLFKVNLRLEQGSTALKPALGHFHLVAKSGLLVPQTAVFSKARPKSDRLSFLPMHAHHGLKDKRVFGAASALLRQLI
jgi:hypothetical protein